MAVRTRKPNTRTFVSTYDPVFRKMTALRIVMERVVRILTNQKVKLIESHSGTDIPAWTDGENIFLNAQKMSTALQGVTVTSDEFSRFVMSIKGLVYHETGHILFTPRKSGSRQQQGIGPIQHAAAASITDRVMADCNSGMLNMWWAFNALEDQRMESLFTATYRPSIPYFNSAVAEWLVKTPEALLMSWPLMYGRRYTPEKLRQVARGVFVNTFGEKLCLEMERVIDDYTKLTFDGTTATEVKGHQLVREFEKLLKQLGRDLPPQPSDDNLPGNAHGAPQITEGKASPKEQQKAQEKVEDQEKQKGKGDSDKADDKDDSDADGDGEDADAEDGDGEESKSKGKSDKETKSEKPTKGGGVGAGSGPGNDPEDYDANDLMDAAEEIIQAIEEDEALAQEVQDIVDTIREILTGGDGLGGMAFKHEDRDAPGPDKQMVRTIERKLAPLKLEYEPERDYRHMSGSVNIRRAITAKDHQTDIFDHFEMEVEQEGGIEVCILLDMSGSMSGQMDYVSRMMWILKSAFDRLDIRTTVLGFSDNWNTLYRPVERASRHQYRSYGVISGTVPLAALKVAHSLLTKSDRKNRVLATITDGGWSTPDTEVKPILDDLHRNGTTSMLLGIGAHTIGTYGFHHHEIGVVVDALDQLPQAISEMVKKVMVKGLLARND